MTAIHIRNRPLAVSVEQLNSDGHQLRINEQPRVWLVGDCDIAGVATITKTLDRYAVLKPTITTDLLVIDLSGVSFMDSTGLTALCNSRDLLQANGWHVIFVGPPRHLSQLIRHAVKAGWLAPDALSPPTACLVGGDSAAWRGLSDTPSCVGLF